MTPGFPPNDLGPLITRLLDEIGEQLMGVNQLVLEHVAIDGSGPDERDPYVSFGLVTGLSPRFNFFHLEWVKFLNKHGLDYLRMADAMSFTGAFAGKAAAWGPNCESIRDEVLAEAAGLIRSVGLRRFGTCYDASAVPTGKAARVKKQVAFEVVINQMIARATESRSYVMMCDADQEAAPQFYRAFEKYKRMNSANGRLLAGLCFFDDTRSAPLQAADMIAYVLRWERWKGKEHPLSSVLLPRSTTEDVTAYVRFSDEP